MPREDIRYHEPRPGNVFVNEFGPGIVFWIVVDAGVPHHPESEVDLVKVCVRSGVTLVTRMSSRTTRLPLQRTWIERAFPTTYWKKMGAKKAAVFFVMYV